MTHDDARPTTPARRVAHGRRERAGLSIQSTVLLMLLGVSLSSNVLVGVIGYFNATDSLRDAAFERLVEVRDSRAREVARLFTTIDNNVAVLARSDSVREALESFSQGFDELASIEPDADQTEAIEPSDEPRNASELDDEQTAALESYYSEVFGPALAEATGAPVEVSSFVPGDPAARYLQAFYTAPHESFASAIQVNDAGDGSAWSAAHAQHHDFFRAMTERLDYEDVLLLDADGVVVYSAFKGVDLGTNVLSGPYRFSNLSAAYGAAMGANQLGAVTFTDFEAYPPSLTLPAAWAVTPIGAGGELVGAMAVELPIQRLSDVMTADGDFTKGGLGATGETYLVAADGLMRSPSRLLLEDGDSFAESATAAGVPSAAVDLAIVRENTLGLIPVRSAAVDAAIAGGEGTTIATNYLGRETLSAYGQVDIDGFGWIVVAEVDTGEAFAPVSEFTRNLVISSAVLALIVSVLSLLLARVFVRPLRRLGDAAQRIAAGETGVTVDAGNSDEMMSVATAFNDMSRSLQVKADLLDAQSAESEKLLRALMPEPVIRRYREGQHTIAEDHDDIAVLYADVVGFDDFTLALDSEATLEAYNDLVKLFDDAAAAIGVEHVRTTTQGYLASSGLTVPRIDNARRIVEFALELQLILDRFSAQWGANLALRAGLDLGSASSGLVGRAHMVYDLWGEAVSLAFRIQAERAESGIFLTERVMQGLPETVRLIEVGDVNTSKGAQRVWRVEGMVGGD